MLKKNNTVSLIENKNQHRLLPPGVQPLFDRKACPSRQWAVAGPDVAKRDMESALACVKLKI